MNCWKVLIVEDDPIILRKIMKLIEEDSELEVIGTAYDKKSFESNFQQSVPDFVIFDIELPDTDGLQLAQELKNDYPNIPCIFVTALAQYAIDSYLVNAVDYILKPIIPQRFFQAMSKMKHVLLLQNERFLKNTPQTNKISIRNESGYIFLDIPNVILIKKIGRKTVILTLSKDTNSYIEQNHYTNKNLKDFQQQLENQLFLRSHNSFIINLAWVKGIEHYSADAYKVTFHHTNEYALLNRNKLNLLMDYMNA